VSGLLNKLATMLDTMGAETRMRQFRDGWPATASPGIRFFETSKAHYRYRATGEGPTIVFAVDPPMTIEVYDTLISVFSRRFRVVVVELAGMGFSSPKLGFTFGFRESNDDLALFLREVAGPKAILAFSCVASHAAIDIAVRMPELVSHLALLQAGDVEAFKAWKAARDPQQILAKPFVGQWVMKRLARKRMPAWYALSVGRREQIPHYCDCAQRSFQHGSLWSLASAYQCYMDPSVDLVKPAQPMLSIWGAADQSHPATNSHTLARLDPGAACITFSDLGHTPELEDPERVFSAIIEFLGSNRSGVPGATSG